MSELKHKILQDVSSKLLRYEGSYAEAFFVIDTIRKLSDVAHDVGLLGIQEAAEELADGRTIPTGNETENIKGWRQTLALGFMLVLDGASPEDVERILCDNYFFNKYEGLETLLCAMAIHGVLMIQNGDDSSQISEKMYEILSENVKNE